MQASQHKAYRPASSPLVKPWIVPDRPFLFMARRGWPIARFAIVVVAIGLAVSAELSPWIGLGCVVTYLLTYVPIVAPARLRLPDRNSRYASKLRHVLGAGAVLILILAQAWGPFGAQAPSATLWLLWIIPAASAGAQLSRRWALGLVLAIALVAIWSHLMWWTRLAVPNPSFVHWAQAVVRALMIGLIGLSTYILARSLAYLEIANRHMLGVMPEITRPNWSGALETALSTMDMLLNRRSAAEEVSDDIGHRFADAGVPSTIVVNILTVTPQGLQMTASSSRGGKDLVARKFVVPPGQGVTNWVVAHGQVCYLQNVDKDPEKRFYRDPHFPDIRSELAVPVRVGDRVVAVVDLESQQTHAFHEEQAYMAHVIAAGLAESYEQERIQTTQRRLADLASQIAVQAIDAPEDLERLLREIGKRALTFLGADVIGFYHRELGGEAFIGPYYAGDLLRPDAARAPHPLDPASFVWKLIQSGEPRIFADAASQPELRQRDPWHELSGIDPFIDREKIQTAIAKPLLIGRARIGLMFVNYRRPYQMSSDAADVLELLGTLAAHAIQGFLRVKAATDQERRSLRRDLHDGLSNHLLLVRELLSTLRGKPTSRNQFQSVLSTTMDAVDECSSLVLQVKLGRNPRSLQTIIQRIAAFARSHRSPHALQIDTPIDPGLDALGRLILFDGDQIVYAAQEAIANAVKHARASRLHVTFQADNGDLVIVVADNGVGFDASRIGRGSGLSNLQSRIETVLGGKLTIHSGNGTGTRVILRIPVRGWTPESNTPQEEHP